MNTEENQKMWMNKVRENLLLRGRSENTIINYRCRLSKFFKYFTITVVTTLFPTGNIFYKYYTSDISPSDTSTILYGLILSLLLRHHLS